MTEKSKQSANKIFENLIGINLFVDQEIENQSLADLF
jgi:hypothetical protein